MVKEPLPIQMGTKEWVYGRMENQLNNWQQLNLIKIISIYIYILLTSCYSLEFQKRYYFK